MVVAGLELSLRLASPVVEPEPFAGGDFDSVRWSQVSAAPQSNCLRARELRQHSGSAHVGR